MKDKDSIAICKALMLVCMIIMLYGGILLNPTITIAGAFFFLSFFIQAENYRDND